MPVTDQVILLVEDDADLRDMYRGWLEPDHDVRVAADAFEAVERFDDDVDLVLLDRQLPDRDGESLLPTFRNRSGDCQVAMVTAVDPDWEILEMDFDAYLTKPVREPEVVELVQRLSRRDDEALAEMEDVVL